MRDLLKTLATMLATVVVAPRIAAFRMASLVIGPDRALESSTQSLARSPGLRGQYLRRAFLPFAGVACHSTATICYGTTFSKQGSVIDERVYVGPGCHLGLVHLHRDVLVAAGVHIPSGGQSHGTGDPTIPIREQEGTRVMVAIGEGSWVGSGSVILASVGKNCVIGAGSVVTRPVPDGVVAAGVPARVVRERTRASQPV